MTLRIGAVWMFLNLAAAVFLGAEFIVQKIRELVVRHRQHDEDQHVASIPSIGHRA
ncbi:MAG TPA: hypothetical protein VHZ09_03775 [Acidobacteriaceae bacterium]|jgi:hypothetical protein|nr:hypothetical protein [Acidobacteriaceae bacterium]